MKIFRRIFLGIATVLCISVEMSVLAENVQWEYAQYQFSGYDLDKSNLHWQLHHKWYAPGQAMDEVQLTNTLEQKGINFTSLCHSYSVKQLIGKPTTYIDCEEEDGGQRYYSEILPLKMQILQSFGASGWELVDTTHTDGMMWGTIIKDQNEIYNFRRKKN